MKLCITGRNAAWIFSAVLSIGDNWLCDLRLEVDLSGVLTLT